jgi:hypothetical protein
MAHDGRPGMTTRHEPDEVRRDVPPATLAAD